MVFGFVYVFVDFGCRVSDDVSIIGFDDILELVHSFPLLMIVH